MTWVANAPHTKLAHSAWFHAEAIKPTPGHRFVYVRKTAEGQVVVFQRHFIKHMSSAEAKQSYFLNMKVPMVRQSAVEADYQHYLHF